MLFNNGDDLRYTCMSQPNVVIDTLQVNIKPVAYAKNKGVFLDLKKHIDTEGILPYVDTDAPAIIKDFLNTNITNEINRKLRSRVKDSAFITNYNLDRKELIEASREIKDYKIFNDSIDFKGKFKIIEKYYKDVEEEYKDDKCLILIYITPIKAVCVKDDYILNNDHLERGITMGIPADSNLAYFITNNESFSNHDDELILYTQSGKQYLLGKSVHGYNTIRVYNDDEFFSLHI